MEERISTYHRVTVEIIPILFLILSVIVFFWEILYSGRALFGHDFVLQFYPWKKFIYDHMGTHGSLPFWNPYLFSGTPFISNMQTSMFYPLGFLYYLFPPELAYGYSTILHCILGSLFMYAFMRTLSVSPWGAFLSSFIFTFNGYFMAHLYAGHLSFVQNYIWIPLIFRLVYQFIHRVRFNHAVLAGLLLGIQILGGFPQIAFYTIIGVFAFILFHAIIVFKEKDLRDVSRLGVGLIIIMGIAFSLAAVQVLPTLEFTMLSTRAGGLNYEFATYDSLHPKELFSFLIPDIFGNPVDQTYWKSREDWHFWETCGYVGLLPLFLIFAKISHRSIRYLRIFFFILIFLSLSLSLGKHNLFYPLIYKLPGFNNFRIPAQILFLYVFSVAVVSGMAIHRMQDDNWQMNRGFFLFFLIGGLVFLFFVSGLSFSPHYLFKQLLILFAEGSGQLSNIEKLFQRICFSVDKGSLIFFGSALLILMGRSGRLGSKPFNILAVAIVVMDLYLFSEQFIKPYDFLENHEKEDIVLKLEREPEQGRSLILSSLFQPNDGLTYRFPSITGYNPLILKRYVYYIQSSQKLPFDDHVVNLTGINAPDAKLLKLLNVRQVVLGNEIKLQNNEVAYANIVNEAVSRPSRDVLDFMNSEGFDPTKMVVLEDGRKTDHIPKRPNGPFKASYSVLHYDNENIRIRASTNGQGYLVLSEIFYPGWRASIDGKEIPVLCGNYLYRVIPLSEGEHEIRLYFVSWPFRVGAAISLLTLIGALLFVLWKRKKVLA